MKIEIERRFLVAAVPPLQDDGQLLHQGYLSREPVVRVRLPENGKAQLTIKGPGTLARPEFEYEIPVLDARELLKLCGANTLRKRRYPITHHGKLWVVDMFTDKHEGLCLAEIELKHEEEKFDKPSWVGAEVTDDTRYSNVNLAFALDNKAYRAV